MIYCISGQEGLNRSAFLLCVRGLLVLCAARRGWLSGYSFQSSLESVHVDYDTCSMTGLQRLPISTVSLGCCSLEYEMDEFRQVFDILSTKI